MLMAVEIDVRPRCADSQSADDDIARAVFDASLCRRAYCIRAAVCGDRRKRQRVARHGAARFTE